MPYDIYQTITDSLIAKLEAGALPWVKPWATMAHTGKANGMPLRHNGTPYQGMNVFLLWMAKESNGWQSDIFMTFKQAKEYGGNVRKGEHGSLVVFASKINKKERDATTGEDKSHAIFIMKGYTVFNADQIDGLPERFNAKPCETPVTAAETNIRHDAAESLVTRAGASVRHGGNRAFYSPAFDHIQMPHVSQFADAGGYYGTLLHELTYWTGHESRCKREFGKRFGDMAYAFEELVAELGAAFLCAATGVSNEPRADHASYLASWLKVLKQDKRAIFTAARLAQAAADSVLGAKDEGEEQEAERIAA